MSSATAAPAARRTQQERKDATVARLIDATIGSILEVGYARTSVGEICRRAGSSKGGLFRHFETRLDVVVAAAEAVADRHLDEFGAAFADREDVGVADALSMMRDRHRDDINVVWFELLVAARTDGELRERLEPVTRRFHAAMDDLARLVPALAALPEAERHLLVSFARNQFDGETITRAVVPDPPSEDARLALLVDLAGLVLAPVRPSQRR